MTKKLISRVWVGILILSVYLTTHLIGLTKLPVFADESIYIRWAQLIIDDWSRYLFFPLNDGKTPLFVWLQLPFHLLISDPLLAARLLAVMVGAAQLVAAYLLTRSLGGKKRALAVVSALTMILPFWFFHHRMALMDGLLTLWLTLAFWVVAKLALEKKPTKVPWRWLALGSAFFGLALYSKLPALLFVPVLLLPSLLLGYGRDKFWWKLNQSCAVVLGGLFFFLTLKVHPAFGQLFNRGNDFLYPLSEVIIGGKWQQTLINFPSYFGYFFQYLSWPVMFLNLAGLFSPRRKRIHFLLLSAALAYILPIGILGKVVYARYLLPAVIFLTVGAALAVEEFISAWIEKEKRFKLKLLNSMLLISLLLITFQRSLEFMITSWNDPTSIPFVKSDAEQYLLKWSSGHGVTESVELIQDMAQTQRVAVASEGYFGTLPDGLLMYLHNQDVSNIYVEGVGVPISGLPTTFVERAKSFDRVLIVANSHRLKLKFNPENLLLNVCRPYSAPCLQVWDVTDVLGNIPTAP